MDGAHDLGGRMGFGPVVVERDEPVFHEPWERTARGLVFAVVSAMPNPTTSAFRHAIERMDPAHYLSSSYYEHWLTAAATLAVEHDLVRRDELEEAAGGSFPLALPVHVDAVVGDTASSDPRFDIGDTVRVRDEHPWGHTRCPDYVRGHVGVVIGRDGAYSVPDVEAHSTARAFEATYRVRFDAGELWGDGQTGASASSSSSGIATSRSRDA